ncbi:ferredoxin reductase family protein [Salinarimonas chemoclinalis]|uniref:ferredoxin reductase family protein n=1 Tax=Salinarimonas chemoclinalis TaxID=3241599 RepID=UPI003555BFE8
MGLGFAGLGLFGLQFVLTARFRRLTSPFGIDVVYLLHRYLAWIAIGLVATHFAILWLFYEDALGVLDPREARWELTSGRAALLLLGAAVVTSQWRKPLRLEYGAWRYLHAGLATLGFAAAIAHVLGVGTYTTLSGTTAIWVALTASWLGAILWVRLVKPWRQVGAPYRVMDVQARPGDVATLALEPQGHPGLRRFAPGQFAWLTLRSSPFLLREHPFSIESPPEELPRLRFGIKALGDFSGTIRDVAPGEIAYLDGPYGVFSVDAHPDASGYVFIAGGIGVTPILSVLRSLAERGETRPLRLLYGNPTASEITYREEIDALATRLDLTVVHVLADPPDGWDGERGYVTREILERHLPASREGLVCFLCGPTPMTEAARAALQTLGVPASHIRTEVFEFV